MDNEKQTTPSLPNEIPAATPIVLPSKPKKPRIGKGMILFLLGILTGIILTGLYTIAVEELKKPSAVPNTPSSQTSSLQAEPGKEKITDQDLKNYVDAKDCSTLPIYNSYTISLSRLTMKTISLEDSLITAGKEGGTNYIRWTTLPVVVDYQCNVIALTDIKAGDSLTIYTVPGTGSDYASDTRVIQKANK